MHSVVVHVRQPLRLQAAGQTQPRGCQNLCSETGVCVLAVIALLLLQERERLETAQEAKRQKLETVPRALHRLYE